MTKKLTPSTLWTLGGIFLGIVFILDSVFVVVRVNERTAAVSEHVGVLRDLSQLDQAISKLPSSAEQLLDNQPPDDAWPNAMQTYRDIRNDLRQRNISEEVVGKLGEVDDAVEELTSLRSQMSAPSVEPDRMYELESECDATEDVVMTAIAEAVTLIRSRTSRISGQLAGYWRHINILVLVACVLAVGFGAILLLHQREMGQRSKAEKALQDANETLEQTVRARTAELSQSNIALRHEINRREKSEQELRHLNEVEHMLYRELDHRVRNNISSLVSLIQMTRTHAESVDEFADTVLGRASAIGRVHTLLTSGSGDPVMLDSIIESMLPPSCAGELVLNGPAVTVPSAKVTPLAMVIHELMSNSLKYGSLAWEHGEVDVSWITEDGHDGETTVHFEWCERSGQPVTPPTRAGVGTKLIQGLLKSEFGGHIELRYPVEGVHHCLTVVFAASHPKQESERCR